MPRMKSVLVQLHCLTVCVIEIRKNYCFLHWQIFFGYDGDVDPDLSHGYGYYVNLQHQPTELILDSVLKPDTCFRLYLVPAKVHYVCFVGSQSVVVQNALKELDKYLS